MSIWQKILSAVRGAATEAGEAVVDQQAVRILEQEMRDARSELDKARESLTSIMAEEMGVKRKVESLRKKVEEHEGYAMSAMDKGDEGLAMEIADKIAELANDQEAQETLLAGYTGNVKQLKRTIVDTERNIKTMAREVSAVKATEAVQKASSLAAAKFSGSNSSMRSATDSLERIKAKQQKRSDQMNAALEMQQAEGGDDLKAKLKSAGIVTGDASANSVLERLKQKRLSQE